MYLILHVMCILGLFVGHVTWAQAAQEPVQEPTASVQQVPVVEPPQSVGTQDQVPATSVENIAPAAKPEPQDQQMPTPVASPAVQSQSSTPAESPAPPTSKEAVPTLPQAPVPASPKLQEAEPSSAVEAPQAQPAALTVEKPVLEEIKGINTVDLDEPRGNWLFKRIWWERAEQKYEKIRVLVEKLIDSRMEFFEKRTQFDKQSIEFYHDIGLDQGALKATINQLISQLNKAREKEGTLSLEDREMYQVLLDEKKSVEQLQTYVEMITSLDREFDSSLHTLLEQMNAIRRYEADAWQNFKEIARVLSDTKARELYYGMDVAFSNIKEVQEYLQEPFREHIDHIISMMTTHIQFIKDVVQKLSQKGIDLVAQVENKESTVVPVAQESEEDTQDEAHQGWISWTFSSISAGLGIMWDSLVSVVTWPYRKLFGPSESESEESEDNEEQEREPESQDSNTANEPA